MSGLVGAWRLESWSLIHEDGRPPAFPMGSDARGYILYMAGGQVSATIMRADGERCFAYAGRYEVANGSVIHTIEISTRSITFEGDRLTLAGPDFFPGTARTQRIVWRRA
jgi:hypothetical protein